MTEIKIYPHDSALDPIISISEAGAAALCEIERIMQKNAPDCAHIVLQYGHHEDCTENPMLVGAYISVKETLLKSNFADFGFMTVYLAESAKDAAEMASMWLEVYPDDAGIILCRPSGAEIYDRFAFDFYSVFGALSPN